MPFNTVCYKQEHKQIYWFMLLLGINLSFLPAMLEARLKG